MKQNFTVRQGALDGVEVFLSVAHHRSFRRASADPGITPSAVSQAIRALEARTGALLLMRTTRSVGMTGARMAHPKSQSAICVSPAHCVTHLLASTADESALGETLVDAAKRSGVRRIVFSSAIHPTNNDLANHRSKLPVETAIFMSGLDYTILHPATYFQNLAPAWPRIVANGVLAEAFSVAAQVARVDYRDVAEVAAEALTDGRLAGGSFELCAERLSPQDIAMIISDVTGRQIEAAEIAFQDWVRLARPSYDARQLAQLQRVFQSYSDYGSRGNSLTLGAILNRPPRSMRQFIEHLAATAR